MAYLFLDYNTICFINGILRHHHHPLPAWSTARDQIDAVLSELHSNLIPLVNEFIPFTVPFDPIQPQHRHGESQVDVRLKSHFFSVEYFLMVGKKMERTIRRMNYPYALYPLYQEMRRLLTVLEIIARIVRHEVRMSFSPARYDEFARAVEEKYDWRGCRQIEFPPEGQASKRGQGARAVSTHTIVNTTAPHVAEHALASVNTQAHSEMARDVAFVDEGCSANANHDLNEETTISHIETCLRPTQIDEILNLAHENNTEKASHPLSVDDRQTTDLVSNHTAQNAMNSDFHSDCDSYVTCPSPDESQLICDGKEFFEMEKSAEESSEEDFMSCDDEINTSTAAGCEVHTATRSFSSAIPSSSSSSNTFQWEIDVAWVPLCFAPKIKDPIGTCRATREKPLFNEELSGIVDLVSTAPGVDWTDMGFCKSSTIIDPSDLRAFDYRTKMSIDVNEKTELAVDEEEAIKQIIDEMRDEIKRNAEAVIEGISGEICC